MRLRRRHAARLAAATVILIVSGAAMRTAAVAATANAPDAERSEDDASGEMAERRARLRRGETPLQVAAASGDAAEVRRLVARGADVDAFGARGLTALAWAARNGNVEIATILLDAGADVDRATEPDGVPIVLATSRGEREIVRLLVAHGTRAFRDPAIARALVTAMRDSGALAGAGRLDPVLDRAPSGKANADAVDERDREFVALVVSPIAAAMAGNAALADAVAEGIAATYPRLAKGMLDALGSAAADRIFLERLLAHAAREREPEIVRAAIERGADPNMPGRTSVLAEAIERNDAASVSILLAAGADPRGPGVDVTKLAATAGDAVSDRLAVPLLERTGALDARNDRGETLLFRAASRGDDALIRMLLAKHADPSATVRRWPGDFGWTALMAAAAAGNVGAVQQLVAARAPVDQRNGHGRSALFFAAWYGREGVVRALLAAGAEPSAVDALGQTPLAVAYGYGHAETIKLLRDAVERGAEARKP